ncbi:hypothetical protein [Mucilaginibacter pedocola]|uniref:DUF4878 domain-containing protein n=1 Tax=Mucilaginibacter pedocola TaxID=1792845 RepID=A0A1S9P7C7_9SPHI|nr:hypothetical protein [Mucilaginibacter pedocola]OOQ56854.1 hypothetical protein BC343_17900 [Mucilaginibacter pedocola]
MKALKTLLLIAACLLCKPLFAQETPESYITRFFAEYKISPLTAIDKIYASNVWMAGSKEAIDGLKTKLNALSVENVGKYYGQDLITTKQVTSRLKLYSYMVRFDRQPVRFIFKFYKASDKWMLYSFKFDDQMDTELEQSAKLDAFPNPVNVYRVN